jgi:methyl-accepting chemotaxis protein
MLGLGAFADAKSVLAAISRSQAVIEFGLKGNILSASDNFFKALGDRLDEIVGKHHSMFCDAATVASAEYKSFWTRLAGGSFDAGTYQRIAKGGREIWIQASYNPVLRNGRPYKVVHRTSISRRFFSSEGRQMRVS